HACLMDYDYYRDRKDAAVGLVRTATLVKRAGAEAGANALLADNGDLIQGTPLGTFAAQVDPDQLKAGDWIHPAIRAARTRWDMMRPRSATMIELYGLEYLDKVVAGASSRSRQRQLYTCMKRKRKEIAVNRYRPYVILTKTCVDGMGRAA
ncbi:2',3'-cyclic-nucleotide 2'-phosphodiesterase, partial [Paenibacillus sp. JTLBN-2024]